MNALNGTQRLWELVKWVAAIAAALWCVTSYVQSMPLPTDQPADIVRVTAIFLAAVIGGGITYSVLHALEWVYRGFCPLTTAHKEDAPPAVPDTHETAQAIAPEQRPALPSPNTQRNP